NEGRSRMATVQCCKCTAERKGFRRELDSWRHKLIHCVGRVHLQFHILCGEKTPTSFRGISPDCEPEEVGDWSSETSCSQCSFCNLSLDKLILSCSIRLSFSYFSCPSSLDASLGCDFNIPPVAQELMKKMIHQFALEYASKCLLHTSTNGVTTRTSSPLPQPSDAPLDLTVSQTGEESESDPGRERIIPIVNSKTMKKSMNKTPISSLFFASSSLSPSCVEELGDLGQRGTTGHQSSALGAVLSSLCSAHRSLLYQILKLDVVSPNTVPFSEYSKSNCSIHHCPLTDCKSDAPLCSSYCCVQSCSMETYTVMCPERLHCISCQRLAVGRIDNIVFFPSSSICCNQHNPHCCPGHSNKACLTQFRNTIERGVGDGDPPCPVLRREQSPSPPLSPMPSDVNKKTDEKPPSLLHHRQEEEADLMVKDGLGNASHQEADVDTAAEGERYRTPRSSPNRQCQADAHLTEIITTVLHTGSASDYNLSELFNRHDSNEPKSPNTRSRRRQEVLAAIATPADDASTRRQTLQIKRELAMFDQCYSRRKVPLAKRARLKDGNVTVTKPPTSSDSNLVKEDSNSKMEVGLEPVENHRVTTVSAASANWYSRPCKEDGIGSDPEGDGCHEEAPPGQSSDSDDRPGTGKDCHSPVRDGQTCQPHHSEDTRRSRRNIVPPQRFSSYVTEPWKKYYVGCFPESILNQETQMDKVLTSSSPGALSKDPDAEDIQFESRSEAPLSSPEHAWKHTFGSTRGEQSGPPYNESKCLSTNQVFPQTMAAKDTSPTKQSLDDETDGSDCAAKPFGRLRSSPKRLQGSKATSRTPQHPSNTDVPMTSAGCVKSLPNSQVQYTSPIKLMFFSPVKDKEGVRYSLKSAYSGSSAQEPFDPCIERTEPVTSRVKSISSPLNSATSPARSASTRGAESQRSPGDSISFHETTPKRRPGRPKKLGPQLEQKAKRPIGRPRKEKAVDSVMGAKTGDGKSVTASEVEENVNKNLKITVVYGRSRRNKRMVSEGFDQLQTEFHDAWQAVGLKGDLGILMHNSKTSSGNIKAASTELPEELNLVGPVKESAPPSSSNLKCQKRDDSAPSRKPGRPAKVKISGISVTVTTVSPRQRKIQINKDTLQSPETPVHRKVLLPEFKSAKEPWTVSRQSTSKIRQTEEGVEAEEESKGKPQNQPVAVRHSMRVRKPSIHFLHAVATSRSYSHSNALLRRSKQLLLNKANNERRQGEHQSGVEMSREKRRLCGPERNNISQDLSRVAGVSVNSIFTSKETLRWWAASAEEPTMNQELARRIRLISDTWVSNTVENQEKEPALKSNLCTKGNGSFTRNSKHSSVRMLFDCPPNTPRSCSMQQLCSWYMQTTETQSLAIVKKTSSRNPYEFMHFPRSFNKTSVCPSPQAERLRKHIKKFAKTVPKSPLQHQRAQKRLRKRHEAPLPTHKIRRRLFTPGCATGRLSHGALWWRRDLGKYRTTLCRARTRFLTRKERKRWRKRQRDKNIKVAPSCSNGHVATGPQPKRRSLRRSAKDPLSDHLENSSGDQTLEPVDATKEQNLCSKAWSPETLKECRVFLRKINSPDNESAEEEWDSCTVTLDNGSPSAYLFAGRERELVGVVKAVKTDRKRSTASMELPSSEPKSVQEPEEMPAGRQKGKHRSPGVVSTESPQPPPAKTLRQSRMRGLTGPRWCDFVFGNYPSFF
uniref:Ligand dependent nuclear receptor corepressor-like n=1 Tax=Cyclopterus lumpus TaxID=8103 RepID=A0A8C3AK31_CYCLU